MTKREGSDRGERTAQFEPALLLAYALGRSRREAAAETGLSVSTVDRRFGDEEFLREGDRLRAKYLARAVGEAAARAGALANRAVEVMGQLLEHRSPWVRLNASRGLLETLGKLRQDVDFAQRVGQLEEQLERLEAAR